MNLNKHIIWYFSRQFSSLCLAHDKSKCKLITELFSIITNSFLTNISQLIELVFNIYILLTFITFNMDCTITITTIINHSVNVTPELNNRTGYRKSDMTCMLGIKPYIQLTTVSLRIYL